MPPEFKNAPSASARWSPPPAVAASIGLHAAGAAALLAEPSLWGLVAGGLIGNHLLLAAAGMWPQGSLLGPTLSRLPEGAEGMVALTFDDGPDPAVTPGVLDSLDACGARASFFCIGTRARAHPGLVRKIVARGHSVENHTATHPLGFACFGMGRMRREIETGQALLGEITGRAPRFFRPPVGIRSPLLDPVLAAAGLRCTTWRRRGLDCLRRDPGAILRALAGGLSGRDIVLLHDGSCARMRDGRAVVLAVLPALLEQLRARGLRGVSLPEAFG